MLLLDTGLRVSEAARLKIGDVNTATGEIFVDAHGTGRKTTSRHVYLGKNTLRYMWKYLADRKGDMYEDAPLLLTREGRPMDRNSIRLMLVEAGKRAGVRNTHPHRFRHTMAIEFLRNGGDVFNLQKILGHSTLKMVEHYLSLAQSDTKNAHRKASPGDRWSL